MQKFFLKFSPDFLPGFIIKLFSTPFRVPTGILFYHRAFHNYSNAVHIFICYARFPLVISAKVSTGVFLDVLQRTSRYFSTCFEGIYSIVIPSKVFSRFRTFSQCFDLKSSRNFFRGSSRNIAQTSLSEISKRDSPEFCFPGILLDVFSGVLGISRAISSVTILRISCEELAYFFHKILSIEIWKEALLCIDFGKNSKIIKEKPLYKSGRMFRRNLT